MKSRTVQGKDRKEIIKLLRSIRDFLEKRKGEDTPTRLAYIDTYIKEYSRLDYPKITQSTFVNCHDPKSEAPDLKSTVRKYMGEQFRPFLEDFFKTDGNSLPCKLTIPKGNYYLDLVKNKPFPCEQEKEQLKRKDEVSFKSVSPQEIFNTIEAKLIDFFKIIYHAYAKPTELIARTRNSKFLNVDALLLFLLAMVLIASIFLVYIEKFNFPPILSADVAKLKEQVYGLLSPLKLIFSVSWIPMITLILWFSYRVFKGSATFPETLNFQFYFWSSWLPFLVIGALADLKYRINQADNTLPCDYFIK